MTYLSQERRVTEAVRQKKSIENIYESLQGEQAKRPSCRDYHSSIYDALKQADAAVCALVEKEYKRVQGTLQLIAAENQCSRAVLAALGSVVQNKTTEGFPGSRFHGGSKVVDDIELLAVERAKEVFEAQYANVQAHSGTQANHIVITSLLNKGDRILSLGTDQGGHVSHGADVSFTGKFFEVHNYYVDDGTYLLNYEKIRQKALECWPKLIICGATAYSRILDFEKFREIADEVGAFLMADVSHISGLIMGGAHPSPVNHAHFTTTSTYKPGGPRGGLILMGRDYDKEIRRGDKNIPLWQSIEKMTFPGVQGTPYLNHIAAKAVFFKEAMGCEYQERQSRIVINAKRLADNLVDLGYDVLTGGTDNHMVLVNVTTFKDGLTGYIAQNCLEDCGIIVNMNRLPYDKKRPKVTSGVRFGTPIITKNGMGEVEIDEIAGMVDAVLRKVEIDGDCEYRLDEIFAAEMREKVNDLCSRFAMRDF